MMIKTNVKVLDKILKKAEISPDLRIAVAELKNALKEKDIVRAYEVSAVKSYICTSMGERRCSGSHFTENGDYNRKVLGMDGSVYSILDNIHFDLAMKAGKIPAGMMIFSAEGIQQKGSPIGKSKTLELMKKEQEKTERKYKLKKVI